MIVWDLTNSPPTIIVPESITVTEDVSSAITGISFADEDAGQGEVMVTFTVERGLLSVSSEHGVNVSGSGTNELTLRGTIANINAFIEYKQIRYTTAPNDTNNVVLSIFISDQGNTGTGGEKTAEQDVTLHVIARNNAPVLSPSNPSLHPVRVDTLNNAGQTVASFIGNSITDVDVDAEKGIAITSITGAGTWEFYSTNENTWKAINSVSSYAALLLRDTDQIRYQPNNETTEMATIRYRAWDRTTGTAEGTADTTLNGGTTAFSVQEDTASLEVYATPATVTSVSVPANGLYRVGQDLYFTVHWSEKVTVNGTPSLDLQIGSLTRTAEYVSGSGSHALLFHYTIQNGDVANAGIAVTSLRLNGGVIRNFGQDAILALNNVAPTSGILVDGTPRAPELNVKTSSLTRTDEKTISTPTRISDIVSNEGIAIFGVRGNGAWQYSTDGATWSNIGAVSVNQSLLLSGEHYVRYVPDYANGETAHISIRAWNKTSGTAGTRVDTTTYGEYTPYSTGSRNITLIVDSVNDAPTLTPGAIATLPTINENTIDSSGYSINAILDAVGYEDVDNNALKGIAITAFSGNGTWQYTNNVGWVDIGSVNESNALLISSSRMLRYIPDQKNGEIATIEFRAWDRTTGSGNEGWKVDTTTNGGSTAFSTDKAQASITVTDVNDAPVLTPLNPSLNPIRVDDTNIEGQTVASFIRNSITDVDNEALKGIAITSTTGVGSWKYSLDGGNTWQSLGEVSQTSSTLLRDIDVVKFVPSGNNTSAPTISYRAWDQTEGMAGESADTTSNGGATAYSTTIDTASVNVVNLYNVTFEVAEGSTVPPQQVYDGEMATEPTLIPEKEGYRFKGWYTDNTFETTFSFQAPITTDTIIYAKWDLIMDSSISPISASFDKYSVNQADVEVAVALNGNTLLSITNGERALVEDSEYIVAENTAIIKKEYLAAQDNGVITLTFVFSAGANASLPISISDTTPRYQVIYDGNEHSGGAVPVDNNEYVTGANVTVLGNPGNLVREGYRFVGWSTSPKLGEGTIYNPEDEFTIENANVTLYAVWLQVHTVTYDGNGNTSGVAPMDPNTYRPRLEFFIILGPGNLEKEGHSFDGWNTQSNGEGNKLNIGGIYTVSPGTTNVTLYAQWKINEYTVTFNTDGGTTVEEQSIKHNDLAIKPDTPNKQGYTLVGWFKDIERLTEWKFETDKVLEDTTLYAKWERNTYTVTFADYDGTILETVTVQHGEAAEAPAEPSREGHTFRGWSVPLTNVTENVTAMAEYTVNRYTVRFESNGGSEVSSVTESYGATLEAPEEPTKEGHRFVGWYKDEALTEAWAFAIEQIPAIDITLYAKWEKIGSEPQEPQDPEPQDPQDPEPQNPEPKEPTRKVEVELILNEDGSATVSLEEVTTEMTQLVMTYMGSQISIIVPEGVAGVTVSEFERTDNTTVIRMTVEGLGNRKVTLTLPKPSNLSVDRIGAFHQKGEIWEYREAKVDGENVEFETDLSMVAIAEKIDVPTLSTPSISGNRVSLSWSEVEGATYELIRMNGLAEQVIPVTGTSYVDEVAYSTTYSYQVRAVKAGYHSDTSNEVTATTSVAPTYNGGSSGTSSSPAPSSYSKTINAEHGGEVSYQGATVTLPAHAFASQVIVTLKKVDSLKKEWQPTSGNIVGEIYEITKDKEGNFKKPITITLPFEQSKVDQALQEVAVYWLNEKTNEWLPLENTFVDWETSKASGEVDHFTKFAVLAIEKQKENVSDPRPAVQLIDIKGHWAEEEIFELIRLGAISGYPDSTFKPNNNITRAEFTSVIVQALGLELETENVFSDTRLHWAKNSIATAYANGIVNGFNENTFEPDAPITREQMATIIAKAFELQKGLDKTFNDSKDISTWAHGAVQLASSNGIINGYPDGSFRPQALATRAEAVAVITRAIKSK